MKSRILWLILSCLMVVALVLSSCAPAAKPTAPTAPTTPTAPTAPTTPTAPTAPTTPTAPTKPVTVAKPTYGGTITITEGSFPFFDTYRYEGQAIRHLSYVVERLAIGDWAVDRNLWSFPDADGSLPAKYMRGLLAESWETPDPLTIILHVRQGVHFHDKPPVNGRELTADDVVWNIERVRKSPFVDRAQLDQIESVNKKDKWTIELRLRPPPQVGQLRALFDATSMAFWPKEVMGKSGEIEDWHNIIGTGPFMIEDYVADSCLTFKRNPSYWGFDERHPEYKLPYADFVKILFVTDLSTRYAAMRTGRGDWLYNVPFVDADNLLMTTPRLLSRGLPAKPFLFGMRHDITPFNDIRVRQAMNMAMDRNEIIKTIFHGHGSYYTPPLSEVTGLYTPYEKLPDKPMWTTVSCKEVLSYNPKKAKELLAAAGYPNGFKTQIDTTLSWDPGYSEVLQYYLAQIGVEARINVQELGTYTAVKQGKKNPGIIFQWAGKSPDPFYYFAWLSTPAHIYNCGCIDDLYFQNLFNNARSEFDDAKREKMLVEMGNRYIEMAFFICFARSESMFIWQPWLKGYAGEGPLAMLQAGPIFARVWVDQQLKKSLGF